MIFTAPLKMVGTVFGCVKNYDYTMFLHINIERSSPVLWRRKQNAIRRLTFQSFECMHASAITHSTYSIRGWNGFHRGMEALL